MSSTIVDIAYSLHDADLLGIDFGDQVKLKFQTTESKRVCVTLVSVKHFICNGLMEGNVVLEFSLTRYSILTNKLIENFFNLSKSFNPKLRDYIEKTNMELLAGNLMLVSLSPSYGCELFALCKDVVFDELE